MRMSSDVRSVPRPAMHPKRHQGWHALPGVDSCVARGGTVEPSPSEGLTCEGPRPPGERSAQMTLDESTISGFIRDFPGEVLRPADAGFAEARAAAVWNGSITRQPSLIARPTTTEAVATVIALCRETGTDVTVRGGGHSAAGSCVEDGAVMIDLSRDERRPGGSGRAARLRRRGCVLGRRRRGDRPAPSCGRRRDGQPHRRRRAHAHRRHRLADVPAGPHLRQPGRRHAGHRRRPHRHRHRRRPSPT